MRFNSIQFKLPLIIALGFLVTTLLVVLIVNQQVTSVINQSQEAEYRQKLQTILRVIENSNERLQKTRLVDAYRDDFQQIALRQLRETYNDPSDSGLTPFVIDASGALLLKPAWLEGQSDTYITELKRQTQSGKEPNFNFSLPNLRDAWGVYQIFQPWGWRIGYLVPLDVKYQLASELSWTLLLIFGCITLAVVVSMIWLVRKLLKPIVALTEISKRMAEGDLKSPIAAGRKDEVGILADNFNRMQVAIAHTVESLRQSEERLELALKAANTGLWDWDMASGTFYFDENYFKIAGYAPDAFPHEYESWKSRVHPDDFKNAERKIEDYIAGRLQQFKVEFRFRTRQGEWMWILAQGIISQRDETGAPIRFTGTHTDINERKQAEQTLQMFRFTIDQSPDGVFWMNKDAGFSYVNAEACRSLGYTPDELKKLHLMDINPYVELEAWYGEWEKFQQDPDRTWQLETIHKHRDGSLFPVEVLARQIRFEDFNLHVAIVRDISQRKQAEEALQQNYSHLQAIYNSLPIIVWSLDEKGIFTLSEGKELGLVGRQPQQVVGQSVFDFYKDNPVILKNMEAGLKGESCEFDVDVDGVSFHTLLKPFFDEHNNVKGLNGLSVNVSEKRKADEELRHLRNYLSNIIDSMPSMLVGVDKEGLVTQWNKTVAQATGVKASKAEGQCLSDLLPWVESEMEKVRQSIRTRQVMQNQKILHGHGENVRYEEVTIYPLITNGVEGAVIRIDDVTERVRLEEMMVQSEKMLSVGGLAAGMAHEINNPLAGMMQTAQVMSNRLGEGLNLPANQSAAEAAGTNMQAIQAFMEARGILRMVNAINDSGKRVAEIVDNMLSFARKSDASVSSHQLDELLDRTLELASTDYNLKKKYDFKTIEIIKEYAQDLPVVPCESAKVQQVLLNILRNGAEAMQETGIKHPRFILRTGLDRDQGQVCIEIEDNGPGMEEDVRKRIFEPFFTTKPVGEGTGLGLSVSYFIITENHRGHMAVESTVGSGTRFIVCLPIQKA